MFCKKKKRKKKLTKEELEKSKSISEIIANGLMFIIIIAILFCLIVFVIRFVGMYHNIDLTFNALKIAHDINLDVMEYYGFEHQHITGYQSFYNLADRMTLEKTMSLEDMWIFSLGNLLTTFIISMGLAFLLGLLLAYYFWKPVYISEYKEYLESKKEKKVK